MRVARELRRIFRTARHRSRLFIADCRGNYIVITALMLPMLIGGMGTAFEVGSWSLAERAMQNAADSAVIAAATNGGANYMTEARAVASQYGYTDGINNVSVDVSNAASCPSGGNTCYSVKITGLVPQYVSQLVGIGHDMTVNGSPMMRISARAVTTKAASSVQYCVLALASSGAEGIHSNGAPFANLAGCDVMSNTTATCNGHDLGADIGSAHSTNNGCGVIKNSNVPTVSDPYVGLASNIPANTCGGSYPQVPSKKKDPALPVSNQWTGAKNLVSNNIVCGDLQLTGNVTVNTGSSAVLVIENGQLDTNGHTFQTSSGSSLTIIFSGTNGGSYTHAPTGGGTLNFNAPTSGTWSGVAIYQDPNLTSGVNISAAGNSPTWDITGLVYLPHSSVTFSGAVNKSNNGHSCFGLVVDNITVNGTASILEHGECPQAGLNLPTGNVPSRTQLVD